MVCRTLSFSNFHLNLFATHALNWNAVRSSCFFFVVVDFPSSDRILVLDFIPPYGYAIYTIVLVGIIVESILGTVLYKKCQLRDQDSRETMLAEDEEEFADGLITPKQLIPEPLPTEEEAHREVTYRAKLYGANAMVRTQSKLSWSLRWELTELVLDCKLLGNWSVGLCCEREIPSWWSLVWIYRRPNPSIGPPVVEIFPVDFALITFVTSRSPPLLA